MSFWFGLLLVLFLIVVILVWWQVAIFSPEVWLVILSSLAFGLFAFRLLSTYVFVIATADYYKERGEVKDSEKLSEKSGKSEEELAEIPLSAALALVLGALAPFRYAFYLAFTLLLLLALALGFLPGYNPVKDYVEALFWGAAITTFITWAFENFAETAVADLAEYELQQGQELKTAPQGENGGEQKESSEGEEKKG
jgi:hypothetical protein